MATQVKTFRLMQPATLLQVIATWAEKLKAWQPAELLKTSVSIPAENEELARGQGRGSLPPFFPSPHQEGLSLQM